MFGFSAISSAPICGTAESSVFVFVNETVTAQDVVAAIAGFGSSVSDTASGQDTVLANPDFGAAVAETSSISDTVISLVDFASSVSEAIQVFDFTSAAQGPCPTDRRICCRPRLHPSLTRV